MLLSDDENVFVGNSDFKPVWSIFDSSLRDQYMCSFSNQELDNLQMYLKALHENKDYSYEKLLTQQLLRCQTLYT